MSCRAKRDPNGTWHIQYRWTDWTGTKKKSQKRGFKTKKEAEEWYAHFILQQTSDPTMTLNDFWEIYKPIVISQGMRRRKLQTVLEKWIEVRKMACKREDRFRHNTIAFWLSDEEKAEVEAKIILSGVPKGEYYRKSVLEQEIKVVSGNYMSFRLSKVLERIYEELHNGNSENEQLLLALLKELIALQKNAPAGNRDITE